MMNPNPFMPYWIVAIILVVMWSMVLVKMPQEHRRFLGLSGAWISALVLTALWQAEAVLQLWDFLNAVLLVWQVALGLMIGGAITSWRIKSPRWRTLTSLALLSIAVNVAAGLHFLWLATVSPGGV